MTTTTKTTSANDAVIALEKSLEKTPPLGRKKQKKGEDKENVNDYSDGVVMGASDDDVDAKSATELQFKRDFFKSSGEKMRGFTSTAPRQIRT